MAIEQREILFDLPEFHRILSAYDRKAQMDIVREAPALHLLDVVHCRDLGGMDWDRRRKFLSAVGAESEAALGRQGLLILARKVRRLGRNEETGFFLPDGQVLPALIHGCQEAGTVLPERGRKQVFAARLMVGLRIHMDDKAMELEME